MPKRPNASPHKQGPERKRSDKENGSLAPLVARPGGSAAYAATLEAAAEEDVQGSTSSGSASGRNTSRRVKRVDDDVDPEKIVIEGGAVRLMTPAEMAVQEKASSGGGANLQGSIAAKSEGGSAGVGGGDRCGPEKFGGGGTWCACTGSAAAC